MSIASAIQNAQQNVANAYTAVSGKGGTLPSTQNLANLPTAINSITGANNTSLSITPTTSAQSFTPSSPYTGYSPVSVSAVTSAIDNNITAGNIKSGVSILGVTGSYAGTTPSGTLNITAEGTYDVTNYASVVVNIVETVTLTVQDEFQKVVSFTINGVDYTSSFSNGYAYIVVPKNTDLVWSATAPGNYYYNPSSGTLNLSSDSTLRLKLKSGDIIV